MAVPNVDTPTHPRVPSIVELTGGDQNHVFRVRDGIRDVVVRFVYEEGWRIIDGPIARLVRSNQKLSRGLGINNVFVFHKITGIPPDSPGMAVIQEAQSIQIFRIERAEDAASAVRRLGLDRNAQMLGVMVAMDESSLSNDDYGDEAGPDSRGLFQ